MKARVFRTGLTVVAAVAIWACETKNPNTPSTSFGAPLAAGPSNGQSFKFNAQPITLTITNSPRTAPTTVTYNVEVASDSGFANKVFTKDGIPEGSGSSTNVTVSGLGSSTSSVTYYWHWKAVVDGIVGQPSSSQAFIVQQQVTLGTPSVADPAGGATVANARPTFTTRNVSRSGPAGSITYQFQVATNSGFSPTLVTSNQIAEGPGGANGTTSWTPDTDLPTSTLFWRVMAQDSSNSVQTGFTGGTSFTVQPFSMKNATIWNNPQDLANWAETGNITRVEFGDFFIVDFDKRTGPGSWPDVGFGSDGSLQYTLGLCLNVGGNWHCSAAIQFWSGRDLEAGGSPDKIGIDWYYDPHRWGAMTGHQPQNGELVGVFAAAGNLRDNGNVIVQERTEVLMVRWGTDYHR
jgi:hypothetical protein